jgi:integrase
MRRRTQRGSLRDQGDLVVVRYRVDEIDADGQRRRRERHEVVGTRKEYPTLGQARRAADRLMDKLTGRSRVPESAIGAEQWFEEYRQTFIPLMKPSSRGSVRSIINRCLQPAFRGRRLDEISQAAAQRLVSDMAARGKSIKTIRNALAILVRTIAVARTEGYAVTRIETRQLIFPSRTSVTEDLKLYTVEQLVRMVDGSEMPWQALLAVLVYLGLRIAEALGLAWDHIDLRTGTVRIRQSAVFGRLQSLKSRTSRADLPVPAALAQILERYRQSWQPNPERLLFATRTGKPYWSSHIRRGVFKPLCKQLGIPERGLHAIRHSMASHLLASGASASVTRDLLRHSSLAITNRYSHSLPAERRHASDALGALIAGNQRTPDAQAR